MAPASKFAILGVPESYELSGDELDKKFRELSLRLHPDRFAKAPPAERIAALGKSSALNDAYRTLRSPVGRAEHLLELAGNPLGEGDHVDQGFLMEILELREELAEARAAGDEAKLASLGAAMTARRDDALARLPVLFNEGHLAEAKEALIALRYFQRFLDEHAGKEGQ
jgi:molecular chaperone HscB